MIRLYDEDYVVICVYFLFMVIIGVIFYNKNKNTSDYLRASGSVSWWLCGASAFISSFTAWSFTGMSGALYEKGSLILMLWFFNAFAYFLIAFFLAPRYRRMRVITPYEAVWRRYGLLNEQIYVWICLALGIVSSGLNLYILALFLNATLGVPIKWCIIAGGITIIIMTTLGGAWAVVASDFVQMLIIWAVTITTVFFTFKLPEIGGFEGFFANLDSKHTNWTSVVNGKIISLWLIAILLNQLANALNFLASGGRFIYVVDDKHARRASLFVAFGYLLGPILWSIPVFAATTLRSYSSDILAQRYRDLLFPQEAIYTTICSDILPVGMMGLLICGLFAATMSSVDSSLNRLSGLITRNVYRRLINPLASEKYLLKIAKFATIAIGIVIIICSFCFYYLRASTFELLLEIGVLVAIPLFIPLVYSFFVRRAPKISCYGTMIVGIITSWLGEFLFTKHLFPKYQWFQSLNSIEQRYVDFSFQIITLIICASIFFFVSCLFYKEYSIAEELRVEHFFHDIHKPIKTNKLTELNFGMMQNKTMSFICCGYGVCISAGVFFRNDIWGRLSFIFCGGVLLIMGIILYLNFIHLRNKHDYLQAEEYATESDS
ncbi:hypothetical protein AAEX28_06040 [Lentisphaerota bacterium WC36G]|nr:hypothetical protein LJT99_08900 [Lentisphaerae bacterium WC36]